MYLPGEVNNEKGEETGRDSRGDSQASGRKEVVRMRKGSTERGSCGQRTREASVREEGSGHRRKHGERWSNGSKRIGSAAEIARKQRGGQKPFSPFPLAHISHKPISFRGWGGGPLAWLTGWC